MLQHEQTDPPTVSPTIPLPVPNAADARVTPDELNAALKALEDRQSSTVAIGSVVDELRLNATPEQIWEQVEKQRAQTEANQMPPVHATIARPTPHLGRRYGRWLLLLAISGTLYDYIFVLHPASLLPTETAIFRPITTTPTPSPRQTITISGEGQVETLPVKGKDVVVIGRGDNIILKGQARLVTVSGDGNVLSGDAPKDSNITGDGNNVQWTGEPHPVAPRPPSP